MHGGARIGEADGQFLAPRLAELEQQLAAALFQNLDLVMLDVGNVEPVAGGRLAIEHRPGHDRAAARDREYAVDV